MHLSDNDRLLDQQLAPFTFIIPVADSAVIGHGLVGLLVNMDQSSHFRSCTLVVVKLLMPSAPTDQ